MISTCLILITGFVGNALSSYGVPSEPAICLHPGNIDHGIIQCSSSCLAYGSVCEYRCRPDYLLVGDSTVTCDRKGQNAFDWGDKRPVCKPTCTKLPMTPVHGDKSCSGNLIGSICTFSCKDGFVLEGDTQRECIEVSGGATWNNESPTCKETCKPIDLPNGRVVCNGTTVGSKCYYECDEEFELDGDSTTICKAGDGDEGGYWTNVMVDCKGGCRKPKKERLRFVGCEGNVVAEGITCQTECDGEFSVLISKKGNESKCAEDELTGKMKWTNLPCCIDCSQIKNDIVFAVDTSESIEKYQMENTMKPFLRSLLKAFGDTNVKVGMFTFDSGAKKIKDAPEFFSVPDEFLSKLKNIQRGGRTLTGDAMEYAQKIFNHNSNREKASDTLWIITDGKVNAGMEEPTNRNRKKMLRVANQLKNKGVKIFALIIPDEKKIKDEKKEIKDEKKRIKAEKKRIKDEKKRIKDEKDVLKEMTDVTGSRKRVIKIENLDELLEGTIKSMRDITCERQSTCPE